MFCKNRITLIGFIGNDAETRFTGSGVAYTRFSVATNASWKDGESGEYKTRTEWHRIIVWGKVRRMGRLAQERCVRRSRG